MVLMDCRVTCSQCTCDYWVGALAGADSEDGMRIHYRRAGPFVRTSRQVHGGGPFIIVPAGDKGLTGPKPVCRRRASHVPYGFYALFTCHALGFPGCGLVVVLKTVGG